MLILEHPVLVYHFGSNGLSKAPEFNNFILFCCVNFIRPFPKRSIGRWLFCTNKAVWLKAVRLF